MVFFMALALVLRNNYWKIRIKKFSLTIEWE